MLEVLSLGAGVQSSTILLMSCMGELPKLDFAIFADTQWEPPELYAHLAWLEEFADRRGLPIRRVSSGDIRADSIAAATGRGKVSDGGRWASMPLYTLSPDGKRGMIKRQCTKEYKIQPIRREIRRVLGVGPRDPVPPKSVRLWMGISRDEARRVRQSDVLYIEHYYPLIEEDLTRQGCLDWLAENILPEPPRSACIGCPLHSIEEWKRMQADRPEQFADAAFVDAAIRKTGGLQGDVFLHPSRKSLAELSGVRQEEEQAAAECESGHCFV